MDSVTYLHTLKVTTWGQLAKLLDIDFRDLVQDEDIKRSDYLWNCQQIDGFVEEYKQELVV